MVVDPEPAGSAAHASTLTYDPLAAKLMSEPGVANVTYATQLPGASNELLQFEFGSPDVASNASFWAHSAGIGANYFETLGIPLVAGRLFTESEIARDLPVAIVDENFVRLIPGGRSALGLMIRAARDRRAARLEGGAKGDTADSHPRAGRTALRSAANDGVVAGSGPAAR
jgi:hypothetical protein